MLRLGTSSLLRHHAWTRSLLPHCPSHGDIPPQQRPVGYLQYLLAPLNAGCLKFSTLFHLTFYFKYFCRWLCITITFKACISSKGRKLHYLIVNQALSNFRQLLDKLHSTSVSLSTSVNNGHLKILSS